MAFALGVIAFLFMLEGSNIVIPNGDLSNVTTLGFSIFIASIILYVQLEFMEKQRIDRF